MPPAATLPPRRLVMNSSRLIRHRIEDRTRILPKIAYRGQGSLAYFAAHRETYGMVALALNGPAVVAGMSVAGGSGNTGVEEGFGFWHRPRGWMQCASQMTTSTVPIIPLSSWSAA